MLKVLLVQPGATDWNLEGRITGSLDLPLNGDGEAQAKRTADEIGDTEIDLIYSSPCTSARQTAEELGRKKRIKTKVIDELRNLDLGLWQGMTISELRDAQPRVYKKRQEAPDAVCPPGGETVEQARTRLTRVIRKLRRKHKAGTIALVVPEPAASLLRSYLEQVEMGDLWEAECQCGSWCVIEVASDLPQ